MTIQYNAQHMCDDGIEETIDQIRNAVKTVVHNSMSDIVPGDHCTSDGETSKSWADAIDGVWDDLDQNLDSAMETVIENLDEHIQYKLDNCTENGDYVHYSDYSDVEEKRDELEKEVSELQDTQSQITVQGVDYRFSEEHEVFMSQYGTVLKLVETEMVIGVNTAW